MVNPAASPDQAIEEDGRSSSSVPSSLIASWTTFALVLERSSASSISGPDSGDSRFSR
jgi:hypothetical protein